MNTLTIFVAGLLFGLLFSVASAYINRSNLERKYLQELLKDQSKKGK